MGEEEQLGFLRGKEPAQVISNVILLGPNVRNYWVEFVENN